jgi:putative nucleotidyltransferase-like protein
MTSDPPAARLDRRRSARELYHLLARLLIGDVPAREVGDEAEWAELIALAGAEGVAPLLDSVLRRGAGCAVPATAAAALAREYKHAVYAALFRAPVRECLCRRLEERAVPVLLLKGAALAYTYYDDPTTRLMADLDLLVPRPRLEEAARCLEEGGCRPASSSLATALRSPWGHLKYIDTTNGVVVELHWDLSEMRRLPPRALEEIWAGARPAGPGGTARILRPGHDIPLLCAQMILRRQYATLQSLFDLHRVLLATDATEAALARSSAARWRLVPCTAHALIRVRELFGTPLAGGLYDWAREEVSRDSLQARVAVRALSPGAMERPAGDLVDLVMNRNWSKLRICFPAPVVLREQYGLAAHQNLLPAYVAHVGRYLRKSPTELRRLWRAWRATPVSESSVADAAPAGAPGVRWPEQRASTE